CPGPTGESNRLATLPRAPWICAGPDWRAQAAAIEALGGHAVAVEGLEPAMLSDLPEFGGLLWWGDAATGRAYAQALAGRDGPIIPLVCGYPDAAHALLERHLCVDTTAAGGNAALLAGG
ncbi:MAG: bifunctional proline dehydrogenase/L-glutamate gamma-semialdehyde dehydrogenase, partial [Shimia sp.]